MPVETERVAGGSWLLKEARAACVAAWRMRLAAGVSWGVRDWSRLRFEVLGERVVLIFGALPEGALGPYVWEKLGKKPGVSVRCLEE